MAKTKQQKELIALLALVAVAALVWFVYFGKPHAAAGNGLPGGYTPINAIDYGRPLEQMTIAQATEYKPSGRNIFVAAPPAPPPSATAVVAQEESFLPQGPQKDPPPPPPILSMTFFGLGTLPSNGPRRAFLLDKEKDEVHIVGEGDTVMNHIRITHIGNDRIEYEDVNTGAKNSTNLEMPPPA